MLSYPGLVVSYVTPKNSASFAYFLVGSPLRQFDTCMTFGYDFVVVSRAISGHELGGSIYI